MINFDDFNVVFPLANREHVGVVLGGLARFRFVGDFK